jgi:Ni,Fe-hydrogenase I large subunit
MVSASWNWCASQFQQARSQSSPQGLRGKGVQKRVENLPNEGLAEGVLVQECKDGAQVHWCDSADHIKVEEYNVVCIVGLPSKLDLALEAKDGRL